MYNQQQTTQFGTHYAQPTKVEMNQALTPEEEQILKSQRNQGMSFKLDQVDALTGMCTHKSSSTKLPDLTPIAGTRVRCNICGEEFDIIDDPAIFASALDIVLSGLQTIKTQWIDIPVDMAREYFTIIPLLKKSPVALQYARNTWNKYQEAKEVQNSTGYGTMNMWNMVAGGGYNPYMGNPYAQPQPGFGGAPGYAPQPQYGYPQQPQPQYAPPTPVGYDAYGYPQQPEVNPFVNPGAPQGSQFVQGTTGYAVGVQGTASSLGQQPQAQQGQVVNNVEVSKQIMNP